jgi:acetyltransferase-like isoleucine patch superfamily enzyme
VTANPRVGARLVPTAIRVARRYGFRAFLRSGVEFLHAKWALRRATSVGSARLVGRVKVVNEGTLIVGDRVRLDGGTVRLELVSFRGAYLSIGDGTYINYGTNVAATDRVEVGRNCAIGQYSIIMDNDYHTPEDHLRFGASAPVVIEDDVWIGARSIVLRGSHIGRGAVIGANSVVKGTIPPYTLAAGSPARVIRQLREAVVGEG